jgi:hypothetical protein
VGVCKRRWLRICVGLAVATALVTVGGCLGARDGTEAAPGALERAPLVAPAARWRARPASEAGLSSLPVTQLNDSFSLIVVREASEWAALWRGLGVQDYPEGPDFASGVVVGLAARLGEPAGGLWPLELRAVRVRGGWGLLFWQVDPGFYHPVTGPSFVDLAHVPGLRHVQAVRIGAESFILP